MEDPDRRLQAIGVVVVVAVIAGSAVAVLAAVTAPSRGPAAPSADWRLEPVEETRVRIEHAGGEPVRGDRLVVTVEGYERHAAWPRRVMPGDGVLVDASGDQTVRLYWDAGRADRRQLARWEVNRAGGDATPQSPEA